MREKFVCFVCLFLVKKNCDACAKDFSKCWGGALVLTKVSKRIKASLSVLQSKCVAFAAFTVARSLCNS